MMRHAMPALMMPWLSVSVVARAGKKLELNKSGHITNDPATKELAWREPGEGWGPLEMRI